ncbi:ankyrin repeat domain-containing protein [Ehrlichia japonica]|uniref:Ankyrin repeat family protein n=1 Tax=Ehrlichia japonica TaxID=391036 RepID=X5H476_9RICK|nr:ankyrin repeat domain-containing protein [Ehrlichia japonica]AHX04885.1 ankyrin repeat family protein [Ehrlichia japonica]
MTDPKKDDLQQNQRNPNLQDNNPPQDSPQGGQDQQLTEGQEQQLNVEEDLYQGIQELQYSDIETSQKDDGQVRQQSEQIVEDIYASPLPKSQRPAASPVLEEPSFEEEETPPPLPPRDYISDIAYVEEEEAPLPPPPMEGEISDIAYVEEEEASLLPYNGPSIRSRDLVDAPYHSSDGYDAMEFQDNQNWESVRNAVLNDKEIDPKVLVTSGLMLSLCDQIRQSNGNLSEEQIQGIILALETNDQGVAEDIFNPVKVRVEGNPVSEGRNLMTLLHLAYAYNVDQRVISAIENTKDSSGFSGHDAYNLQDTEGNLPLHFAAQNCDSKTLSRCISNTGNDVINLRNFGNETFMHVMCRNLDCSVENVAMAKEYNADFAAVDGMDKLPLHHSAACSRPEVLAFILRNTKGCFSSETDVVNMQDQHGHTPLHCAVIGNNVGALPLMLLQNGIDACKRDVDGYMPIHHAVMGNNFYTVKALCLAKASVVKGKGSVAESLLSGDFRGNTPLHLACSLADKKVFIVLKKSIQKYHGKQVFYQSLLEEGTGGKGLDLSGFTTENTELGLFNDLYKHIQSVDFVASPVHRAIQHNNLSVLSLLSNLPDVLKQESSTGVNSCHMAMLFGNAETAKLIVNGASKAEVNAQSSNVTTPLHLACIRGDNRVIKVLVSHKGLDINQGMGPSRNTVLHYAISKGDHSLIKKILGNPNIDVNVKNAAGKTALHEAVDLGDLKVVKALCAAGADASVMDGDGKSMLSHAISSEQNEASVIRMVKMLLGNGATLGSSEDKNMLLEKCTYCGYNKLLNMLLNHKGVTTYPSSDTYPLSAAVICNNMAAAQLLISHGGDVNQKVPNPSSMHFGNSLLMVAVENSNLDMVKLLVQNKCDAAIVGSNGMTAYHMVASHKDVKFAEKALKAIMSRDVKVVLSRQDNNGNTPLHLAMESGNFRMAADMMRAISKKDLSKIVGVQNQDGNTLLHMAIQSGNVSMVKSLLNSLDKRQLANLACVPNKQGDTPLHLAMQGGHPEFVVLMLKSCKKVDLSRVMVPKDAQGNTLLHLACKATGHSSVDSIVKLAINKLDKGVLTGLVNNRNAELKTPMHYALSQDSKYSSKFLPLCNTNTLAVPGSDGKLLSECISQKSKLRKSRGLFGLQSSLFESIVKSEAVARSASVTSSELTAFNTGQLLAEEKKGSDVEISSSTSSESLAEDKEKCKMLEEKEHSVSTEVFEEFNIEDIQLSEFAGSLISSLSSFSTFSKGSSSSISQSSDQQETPTCQMQELSEEIEGIAQDISQVMAEPVDDQAISPPSLSQSTTAKKSSCHSK